MRILVPVKYVVDPYVSIKIDAESQEIQTNQYKLSMNPFDEIALEQAIRLKEEHEHPIHITAVTIAEAEHRPVLLHALALGADEAIHIVTPSCLQPLSIAKVLRQCVLAEEIDLVLLGKQAIDGDNNQTAQMLSALLAWPQATFASSVRLQDAALEVSREVEYGLQTVRLSLPAVVSADLRLNEPRFAALPNIMKAKSKPLQVQNVSDFNLDLSEDCQLGVIEVPKPREPGRILESVDELLQVLKQQGTVLQ